MKPQGIRMWGLQEVFQGAILRKSHGWSYCYSTLGGQGLLLEAVPGSLTGRNSQKGGHAQADLFFDSYLTETKNPIG